MLSKIRRFFRRRGENGNESEEEKAERLAQEAEDAEARRLIALEDVDKASKGRVSRIFFFVVGASILLYIIGLSITAAKKTEDARLKAERAAVNTDYKTNITKDLWMQQTEDSIAELESGLKKATDQLRGDLNATTGALAKEVANVGETVKEAVKEIRAENKESMEQTKKLVSDLNQSTAEALKLQEELLKKEINAKIVAAQSKPQVVVPTPPTTGVIPLPTPPSREANASATSIVETTPTKQEEVKEPQLPSYSSVTIADIAVSTANYKTATMDKSRDSNKTISPKFNLPSGIVRATLITGTEAPVFQQGQQNPHPVLLSLDSSEIGANSAEAEVTDCLGWANASGDMSSERAHLRIVSIECIVEDIDGQQWQLKYGGGEAVIGWAIDEVGVYGLQGRLVTRNGAQLARLLAIGFLQGLSEYGTDNTLYLTGDNDAAGSSVRSGVLSSVFGGADKALEMLANYYMKVSDETFPVISIMPGRHIAVMLKEQQAISAVKVELVDINHDFFVTSRDWEDE
jgi:conjugal transfer pilus assembly protein TraB